MNVLLKVNRVCPIKRHKRDRDTIFSVNQRKLLINIGNTRLTSIGTLNFSLNLQSAN